MKQSQRNAALHALHDSAEENGGTPVYAAVSRATGVARSTLRAWWTNGEPRPDDQPPPAAPPPPSDAALREAARARARELLAMSEEDYRAEAIAELIEERDRSESDTARSNLTVQIVKLTSEIRGPDDTDEDDLLDQELWVDDILSADPDVLRLAVIRYLQEWGADDEIRSMVG